MKGERDRLTEEESKKVLSLIINSKDIVYQYLTAEDEKKLIAVMPEQYTLDLKEETSGCSYPFDSFPSIFRSRSPLFFRSSAEGSARTKITRTKRNGFRI